MRRSRRWSSRQGQSRWHVLARGVSEGPRERIHLDGPVVQKTTPLPAQLSRALEAFAVEKQGWSYTFPSDESARAVAEAIAQVGGLDVLPGRAW